MSVRIRRLTPLCLVAGLLAAAAPVFGAEPQAVPRPAAAPAAAAGQPAFEWAFRFASALTVDPKDMSLAQELALLDMGQYGDIGEAVRRVPQVEGWRRGVAAAELAKMLIGKGRSDEAKAMIASAREVRAATSGWQGPRIDAHVAQALALLGDETAARALSQTFDPNDRQYFGRPAATLAAAHAARGEWDAAMGSLVPLESATDEDVIWWRTQGYIDISRSRKLTREQRVKALDAARKSAADIAGWRKADALQHVVRAVETVGERDRIPALLEEIETILLAQSSKLLPPKAPMLAETARSWARAGERERAVKLLEAAGEAAAAALDIEQPGIWADIAHGWTVAGDKARAAATYDKAFSGAEALVNARPRCLAVVEIARALGRAGVPVEGTTRTRLDRLYAGLKEPW